MRTIKNAANSWSNWVVAGALLCSTAVAAPRPQQDPDDHKKHAQHAAQKKATASEQLAAQLVELQAKVAKLEAALHQSHQGQSMPVSGAGQATGSSAAGGMNMGSDSSAPGMAKGGMGMMKGMSKGGMKSSSSMQGGEGMGKGTSSTMSSMQDADGADSAMAMGRMSAMRMEKMKRMRMMGTMDRGQQPGRVAVVSALPGFPGASHIYHIGASDHFLEHAEALMLSPNQLKQLAQVHEESQLQQNNFERRIEHAEQELWVLTSAGEPSVEGVAAKVGEIGVMQADMRLAFIRSVGKAAKLLTDEQRLRLVGEYRAESSEGVGK